MQDINLMDYWGQGLLPVLNDWQASRRGVVFKP